MEHKKLYTVRTNYCRCHPETCSCDDWVVMTPEDEKWATFFHKDRADEVCEMLNEKLKNASVAENKE